MTDIPTINNPEAASETFAQRVAREAGERIAAIDRDLAVLRNQIEDRRFTVRQLVAEREDLVRVAGATVKRTVNRKRAETPAATPTPKAPAKAKKQQPKSADAKLVERMSGEEAADA